MKLEAFLEEVSEKTTRNNQYPVLTSSKNGLFLQNDYFNKQVASKDNTGYKIIRRGEFTYRAMSDTGEFYPNMLECAEIGIVSPAYPVFRISNDIILPDYLKYYFRSSSFQRSITSFVQGSTRASMKFAKMKTINIDLPGKADQRKTVQKLDFVRNQIETKTKELVQLDSLIKARFVEMFGSEIGDIPFDDVLVDNTKNGFKLDSSNYANDDEVAIVDQGQKLVCGYTKTRHEKKPWIDESIIFGDHTEIVKFVNFPFYLGADGTKLLSPKDGWNARFLYHYLDINYHKRLGYMRHFKYLKEMTFIKPDMKKQIKFTAFCGQVDKSKFVLSTSIQTTNHITLYTFYVPPSRSLD